MFSSRYSTIFDIDSLAGGASKLQEEHGQFTVASNVSFNLMLSLISQGLISLICLLFERLFSSLSQHSFQSCKPFYISWPTPQGQDLLWAVLCIWWPRYHPNLTFMLKPTIIPTKCALQTLNHLTLISRFKFYFVSDSSLFLSGTQIYQHWAVSINMRTSCFLAGIRLKQAQNRHYGHLKMPKEGNVLGDRCDH